MAYKLPEVLVQLYEAGYHPLPNRAKVPLVPGWNKPDYGKLFLADGRRAPKKVLEGWVDRYRGMSTIGVRIEGGLVVIDIDVDDPLVEPLGAAIGAIVPEVYNRAPLRFGAGNYKRALFCRLAEGEEPFVKVLSRKYGDKGDFIEIHGGAPYPNGTCSRQFGVYGVHSYEADETTEIAHYSWDEKDGVALHEVPLDKLPAITKAQCYAICDAFDKLASEAGWAPKTRQDDTDEDDRRAYDIDEVTTRFDVQGHTEPLAYADLEVGMRCTSSFFDGINHKSAKGHTKCHVGYSPLHDCVCVTDYEEYKTHYPKQHDTAAPLIIDDELKAKLVALSAPSVPKWADTTAKGRPKSSYLNVIMALQALSVRCRLNQFIAVYEVEVDGAASVELSDTLLRRLRVDIQQAFRFEVDIIDINEAIRHIGEENAYDPLVAMLASAQAAWDGVSRIDRMAVDVFNAEDTPLNRVFVRKWMIAAVRRARSPGCKFDNMLVLEAPEATGKSTSLSILGGEYYSDVHTLGLEEKATRELMAGVWIHENAELAGMNRKDENAQKASLSKTVDRSRGAYERNATSAPRRYVEAGTTNDETYLQSVTGNRRYWPVRMLKRVDREALRRDRFQLWGEAAAIEAAGESLELDDEMTALAREAQDERRAQDPWEDKLAQLAPAPNGGAGEPYSAYCTELRGDYETVTTSAITDYLLGRSWVRADSWHGKKVNGIMLRLGWERHKLGTGNDRVWGYRRPRKGPRWTTVVDFTDPNKR